MADEAEWVMDGVIGFLHSPVWNVPVSSFIEQHCLVFNPGEENKSAYTEIYEKYVALVQLLLDSFLEDVGLNADAFNQACKAFTKGRMQSATVTVLEQVHAAQDMNLFKVMMTQKNIELELQALNMLQQRSGHVPDIMKPDEETPVAHSQAMVDNEEERILQEVLRKSKEEYDESMKKKKKPSHVNEAMDKSLSAGKEVERLKEEKRREDEVLQKTFKLAISTPAPAPSPAAKSPQPKSSASSTSASMTSLPKSPTPSTTSTSSKASSKPVSGQEAAANWLLSAKAEAAAQDGRSDSRVSNLSNADPSDLEKRAQYLKQQRDLLIAKKKSAREQSLDAYEKSQPTARPKSARAARQLTQGEVKLEGEIDEKKLAMRKALAERLKTEVIQKK